MSKESHFCEDMFDKTTYRCTDDVKFVVQLPLCDSIDKLGDSRSHALGRFYSLERRLNKIPILKDMYFSFMNEYEQMGHMTLCDETSIGGISYFLPHHGVLNEQSQTTKLIVVFNGSASTDTGMSLNDIQHTGLVIQDDLLDILRRFGQFNVVVCADIEKMYRMVWVVSEQRCLQKILWRRKPDEDVQEYTLNTITYGTRSAAYLAIRCLKQLGLDNLEAHPEASNVILHEFYVDDMLCRESSVTEMIDVCKQVKEILGGAGFNLRKWISNRPEVIAGIQRSSSSEEDVYFWRRGIPIRH
ncbi:uncharacterized protein LOC130444698 [Diorhabda sublineata]|uniref:uncharacterized protein LOC130444698 n=1 Tax=Diorhabda sublineata TaxID=1163346 RepID=UPI0024E05C25|nr:uncharacterized protein LOC130444698 [Diorhabda sublineata]